MAEILGFNKNRSCIEIEEEQEMVNDCCPFNKNRSCTYIKYFITYKKGAIV